MPTTVTTPLLNATLIRSRRLQLGITERPLADLSGLSAPTIGRIEAGESSPDLSLGDLHLLASALAVQPWELLKSLGGNDVPPRPDDVRVEAVLVQAGRLIRREEIADALDWSLERVAEALDRIGARLDGTGQRLQRRPEGTVAIQPAPVGLTDDERERAARSALQHRGLNARTGALLVEVMAAGASSIPTTNSARVALGELANARVLVREGGRIRLSDDTAFSLMLDDIGTEPADA